MSSGMAHFGKLKSQGGDCDRRKQYYLVLFSPKCKIAPVLLCLSFPKRAHEIIPYFLSMRAKEARDIPISEFLESSGIKPVKYGNSGKELWYSSPIRNGDTDPSFKVDTTKNLWFDFGLSKGGNIIDLVCELTNSTVKEALAILDRPGSYRSANYTGYTPTPLPRNTSVQTSLLGENKNLAGEIEKGAFEIISVSEIRDSRLIDYLRFRKINLSIAKSYLKEIHYKPVDKVQSYYALGFPSGESFEVRSKNFKGSIGRRKEISALNLENGKSLSIFEGFMNFLAFLSHHGITDFQNSVIILNSVNLKDRALEVITKYDFSKIYLFLDNDEAGETAKQFFTGRITNTPVIDKSDLYKGYNDFNEMTMETE